MLHIVGIVGLPSRYGGFETLADNLLDSRSITNHGVYVYCESGVAYAGGRKYKGAVLVPVALKANGWQSLLYDAWSMIQGCSKGGTILILGTSGTFLLPVLRLCFPRVRFILNMAGLEWSRAKWGVLARAVIKFNEWTGIKYCNEVIADNVGLVQYVEDTYQRKAVYIPYGGDQFLDIIADTSVIRSLGLFDSTYDFAMARAQEDNNLEMILDAYAGREENLVFVSNWDSSKYGKGIKLLYSKYPNLKLIGPIYDLAKVKGIQSRSRLYVHGHSAGGTNPVLVEAMWAKLPILAYDVSFNRYTTGHHAEYFSSAQGLKDCLDNIEQGRLQSSSEKLEAYAKENYTWRSVTEKYEDVLMPADKFKGS